MLAVESPVDPVKRQLLDRAADNFPGNAYLQGEWVRAVELVRSTDRGWVADIRRPA